MFRTAAATTLAAFTALAASASIAQAAPDDLIVESQADVAKLAFAIQNQMNAGGKPRAFGWQFAIAQNGKLATSDKGGSALSAADNGGTALPMAPTMKMELASATKTITAIATMKLLRANGLTIESSIDPYLPPSWVRGKGFKTKSVKFRHLLSHTSGLRQALDAMPDATRPTNNGWDAMRVAVANGVTVPSSRAYKNANFALLRILNAELWKRSGGAKTVTEEIEIYNTKGIEIGTKKVTTTVPVNEASQAGYALDHMRKKIFEPAGLKNVSCTAADPAKAPWSYPLNATQQTKGALATTSSAECAGARGIRLSALEHVQLLAHLRHGSIIDPDDLETMDEQQLGWNEDSNGGDGGEFGTQDGAPDNASSPGVNWHGGDLIGTNQLHTCGMTFDDGTEASLLVNSQMTSSSPCTVLLNAWLAAD